MKLKPHKNNVTNQETWKIFCPPKEGDKQWVDGRSAKELAKYMTKEYPTLPKELEEALLAFVPADAEFDWDAEYVTALPGKGEGRNHDAILFNTTNLITIEAKADESLGPLIGEELEGASVNKLMRISTLLGYIFSPGFKDYKPLRYQLLTASAGTILEAKERNLRFAVMLVIVFKTNGAVKEENLARNNEDIKSFLKATGAYDEGCFKVIPNNSDVKLYFKEIII